MARAALVPGLVALLVACSPGLSRDLVVYRPPIKKVEGQYRSRVLFVTGNREALGIVYARTGVREVRSGTVEGEAWDRLRAGLDGLWLLRSRPTGDEEEGVLSLFARLGSHETEVRRAVDERLGPKLSEARGRLEAIWSGLAVAADPVEALLPWADFRDLTVRGEVVFLLLSARKAGQTTPQQADRIRGAATRLLEVVDNPDTRKMIRENLR